MTVSLTNAGVTTFETGEPAGNNIWLDRINSALQEIDKALVRDLSFAASDETSDLTTGTAKVTFRVPYRFTLTGVKASLTAASTSGIVTVDVNQDGVSVLSTLLTIDENEKTSATAATPAVISDSDLASDSEITVDIDIAGTGAKGLKIYLIGKRAV